MPSSAGRTHRRVLVTVLCLGVTFAHAQQLRSIESLTQSYLTCVQSAFERRLDDFGVSSLPQAAERAFLDCQSEEDALYTTAVASAPGNTQAMALVRAAVEQLKTNLKAELLAAGRGTHRFSCEVVYRELGLLRLERLPLTVPLRASR